MYRITSQTAAGLKGGVWRVLEGEAHTPNRLDNPNLFFATRALALSACRKLNR